MIATKFWYSKLFKFSKKYTISLNKDHLFNKIKKGKTIVIKDSLVPYLVEYLIKMELLSNNFYWEYNQSKLLIMIFKTITN